MTILDKIIAHKQEEVRQEKEAVPVSDLEKYPAFSRTCLSFRDYLTHPEKSGIIAEYKRASPSKGLINGVAPIEETVGGYQAAGASAVSVLTDTEFFKGSLRDLTAARSVLDIPLLRKEFIIDEYQLLQAKAYGADMVLLIAAVLDTDRLKALSSAARSLGLQVLLEIHSLEELERSLIDTVDAIGVNNRNLNDFTVSLDRSFELAGRIPGHFLKISESGISDPEAIRRLREAGFNGFLIGESFMRTSNPAAALRKLVEEVH